MQNELPPMTQTEARALLGAIGEHFGPCTCQTYAQVPSLGKAWIETCEGHQFLNEEHRLARLLWIKRTVSEWEANEHAVTPSQRLSQLVRRQLAEIVDAS